MPKDWRGRQIMVGSTVVYPGRSGSSLWMNEGVIEELSFSMSGDIKDVKVRKLRERRYGRTYPASGRVTSIVRADRLTVVG